MAVTAWAVRLYKAYKERKCCLKGTRYMPVAQSAAPAIRPRRSVLYMPASRVSALEKAKTLPADALIFDLEDAVAPDAKAEARGLACAAAASGEYGKREIVIRANGLATLWGYADITAIARSGASAVLIPKVESAAMLSQVAQILDEAGAPPAMTIWAMVETPVAMLQIQDIARFPRLSCLVMGTSDLAKDLQAVHTRDRLPFVTGLGLCLLAARAYKLAILDGVHLNLADEAEFEAHCVQGLEMGFDGKTLIHPKQVEPANRVFAPSDKEIDDARRIVAAHAEAEAKGQGVVLLDGRLIENLHVEGAHRTLAVAEAIAALA
jgi:citrate lyase subunit beta/citryl-CoA lyase